MMMGGGILLVERWVCGCAPENGSLFCPSAQGWFFFFFFCKFMVLAIRCLFHFENKFVRKFPLRILELFFDGVCGPRSETLSIIKDFSPSRNG